MTTVLGIFVFGLMLLFGIGFPLLIAFIIFLLWRWAQRTGGECAGPVDHWLQDRPQIDPAHASGCDSSDGDD